jgi:hypothetical protein
VEPLRRTRQDAAQSSDKQAIGCVLGRQMSPGGLPKSTADGIRAELTGSTARSLVSSAVRLRAAWVEQLGP